MNISLFLFVVSKKRYFFQADLKEVDTYVYGHYGMIKWFGFDMWTKWKKFNQKAVNGRHGRIVASYPNQRLQETAIIYPYCVVVRDMFKQDKSLIWKENVLDLEEKTSASSSIIDD